MRITCRVVAFLSLACSICLVLAQVVHACTAGTCFNNKCVKYTWLYINAAGVIRGTHYSEINAYPPDPNWYAASTEAKLHVQNTGKRIDATTYTDPCRACVGTAAVNKVQDMQPNTGTVIETFPVDKYTCTNTDYGNDDDRNP